MSVNPGEKDLNPGRIMEKALRCGGGGLGFWVDLPWKLLKKLNYELAQSDHLDE